MLVAMMCADCATVSLVMSLGTRARSKAMGLQADLSSLDEMNRVPSELRSEGAARVEE